MEILQPDKEVFIIDAPKGELEVNYSKVCSEQKIWISFCLVVEERVSAEVWGSAEAEAANLLQGQNHQGAGVASAPAQTQDDQLIVDQATAKLFTAQLTKWNCCLYSQNGNAFGNKKNVQCHFVSLCFLLCVSYWFWMWCRANLFRALLPWNGI